MQAFLFVPVQISEESKQKSQEQSCIRGVALPLTLRMKNATAFCFQSTKARAHHAKNRP
jgi:hypothetical protein